MTCPYCKSTDVKERSISIFESDHTIACEGFDPFAIKFFSKAIKNAYKKMELANSGKKNYMCYNCYKEFQV